MVDLGKVSIGKTCGVAVAMLLIALCHPVAIAVADQAKTVSESPVAAASVSDAPEKIRMPNEETDPFAECASAFFTPTLPADVKKLGLKYSPTYSYAWFVDVVQRVVPTSLGDTPFMLQKARPFFTDKGWSEFAAYLDETVNPFFHTAKNTVVIGRLMAAPRVQIKTALDSEKKPIGATLAFTVDYSARYIQQAPRIEDAKSDEQFSTLAITVLHLEQVQTLKIDSWKATKTTTK